MRRRRFFFLCVLRNCTIMNSRIKVWPWLIGRFSFMNLESGVEDFSFEFLWIVESSWNSLSSLSMTGICGRKIHRIPRTIKVLRMPTFQKSSRHILGPVSLLKTEGIVDPQIAGRRKWNSREDGHKFLPANPTEHNEHSREHIEMQRADREPNSFRWSRLPCEKKKEKLSCP